MMSKGILKLPNLFILGAAKSGTTTLYKLLSSHPQVYFPYVKEPQYFCNDSLYRRGVEYYSREFFNDSKREDICGDATPHYLYFDKVAERIAKDLGDNDLKFIVILRNPVQRAYSLYLNMVREGLEDLNFSDAIDLESKRLSDKYLSVNCSLQYSYVASGLYAKQLRKYFKYFKRENFLIIFQEDLQLKPSNVLTNICDFLNIKTWDFEEDKKYNQASTARSIGFQRFIRGNSFCKKCLGGLLPQKIKYILVATLISLNMKKTEVAPISSTVQARLKEDFYSDIKDLEEITGRDLSRWLD